MAEKKKNAVQKKENKDNDVRVRESLRYDIIILVALAVSILLFIGNLGFTGKVLDTISRFFFGLFGLISYALPFIIVLSTLFLIANRNSRNGITSKCIYIILLIILLSVFFELIKTGGDIENPGAAYLSSFAEKNGGGLFGGLIAFILFKGFGTAASFIITIALFILFLLLLVGRSFFMRAEKKTDVLKKKMELNRMERAKRRELEDEKRRRMEVLDPDEKRTLKVTRGVTLQTDLGGPKKELETDPVLSDEMHEVFSRDGQEIENEKGNISGTYPDEPLLHPLSNDVPLERAYVTSDVSFEEPLKPISDDVHELTYQGGDEVAEIAGREESYSGQVSGIPVEPSAEPSSASTAETPTKKISNTKKTTVKAAEKPATRDAEFTGISEQAASGSAAKKAPYVFPVISLLNKPPKASAKALGSSEALLHTLQKTLDNFGVDAQVTNYTTGPAVTRFEIELKTGVKVAKITNLENDIKLNLAVSDIRIEAPIPGKAAVGIEVPNKEARPVTFRDLMECPEFKEHKSKIAFAAGRDIAGNAIISDIAKMPHLLIAGATGAGKSVCINTIIMSILYKAAPDEVKFIMIDPKIVELSVYNGIPHLLSDVVTDPKKAAGALNWAVAEMTKRYQQFANAAVRDMKGYNAKVEKGEIFEDGILVETKMPQIVVIVDELADLMMVAGKEVETSICRLAQLARAAGIHLIIATQRPSADVITGLIKANMPSRIAFMVSSGIDSRVILDMSGAEKLLGKGDMLYAPQGLNKPLRVQGCFVSDDEVSKVVDFIKENNEHAADSAKAERKEREMEIAAHVSDSSQGNIQGSIEGDPQGGFTDGRDPFFAEAGRFITEKGKGSIGMLQRKFRVGFNRAARIVDQLEEAGIIGPEMGTKPRTALMKLPEFEEWLKNEEESDEN